MLAPGVQEAKDENAIFFHQIKELVGKTRQ